MGIPDPDFKRIVKLHCQFLALLELQEDKNDALQESYFLAIWYAYHLGYYDGVKVGVEAASQTIDLEQWRPDTDEIN